MLKPVLRNLRRKPKVVRDQVALVTAGVFTFVLFGFWSWNLPGQFQGIEDQPASVIGGIKDEFTEDVGPLGDVSSTMQEFMDAIAVATTTEDQQSAAVITSGIGTTTAQPTTSEDVVAKPVRIATVASTSSASSTQSIE